MADFSMEYSSPWGADDALGQIVDRALAAVDGGAGGPGGEKENKGLDSVAAAVPPPAAKEGAEAGEGGGGEAPAAGASAAAKPKKKKKKKDKEKRQQRDEGAGSHSHTRDRDHDRDRDRDRGASSRDDHRRRRSRSRSRDRERERRRGDSRERYRRRSRERYRSRSRSRERRRRRSRSWSRSRDRHRRSPQPRRRSRSRSRSPPRRERGGSGRRDEQPRSGGDRSGEAPEDEVGVFKFTAAQVADRFVEVWGSKSLKRFESLQECLDTKQLEVEDFFTSRQLQDNKMAMSALMTGAGWACEPQKRVYVESDRAADPTFALDFYGPRQSPGFGPGGITSTGPASVSVVVLYRVQHNRITKVWCATDKEDLAGDDSLTEEDMNESDTLMKALDTMIRPGGLGGSSISRHYHDYSKIETIG